MEFGKKIQMLRKSQGISQENLASILKINRNNLSRIETGKSEPTLSIIKNIVNYFNVDVISLMDLDNNFIDTKDKIKKISEECNHLLDNDLDFILRIISVMKEEYVKKNY